MKAPSILGFFILLIASILPLLVSGQALPPRMSIFTSSDYDGHSQIFAVDTLSDGRAVFGMSNGVMIYDGEDMNRIPVTNESSVFSIDVDERDRIFLGGRNVLGVVVPDRSGELEYRSLLHLLPDSLQEFGIVWNTRFVEDEAVYFNAYEELFRYHGGDSMEVVSAAEHLYLLHRPSEHLVIHERYQAFYRLEGTEKSLLPGTKELAQKGVREVLPSADEEDDSWIFFCETEGAYRYDTASKEVTPFPSGDEEWAIESRERLAHDKIYQVVELDPERNVYGAAYAVGSKLNGVNLLGPQGKVLFRLNEERGFPSGLVWDLVADARGNLWTATNSGFALVHTGSPFSIASEGKAFEGGVSDLVRPISEGSQRSPLFISTDQGVYIWPKEDPEPTVLPGSEGQCMNMLPYYRDREKGKGSMIIAGEEALLRSPFYNDDAPQVRPVDTILEKKRTFSLAFLPATYHEGDKGRVLAAGSDGFFLLVPPSRPNGPWSVELSLRDLPKGITTLGWGGMDPSNDSLRIWMGMKTGDVLGIETDTEFDEQRLVRYDTSDGLPEGQTLVFDDPQDPSPLFGTPAGLYRFNEGRFEAACRYGPLYCEGEKGVFLMEEGLEEGEVWMDLGKRNEVHHLKRGEEGYRTDSLPFRFLDIGALRGFFPEKEHTWIGGDKGLALYDPSFRPDPEKGWECRIQEVRGVEDSLLFGGHHVEASSAEERSLPSPKAEQPSEMIPVLPYSDNRFHFRFASPFPDNSHKVRYTYKLAGFDTAWSQLTRKTGKEYTNLPEGDYIFKVKARNVYGKESRTARFRFKILPPWYRTWWAYGGYTVAGVGLLWVLLWLNSRRLVAHKRRLERVVAERTQEIRKQKEETEEQKEKVEEAHQKLQAAHDEITDSIEYARKIQKALLRSQEQTGSHLPPHFVLFKPRSKVSGDFYWAREHRGYFYIAAVDCTGHGVPGAFMAMLGISQLNEIMDRDEALCPGTVLSELRDRVVRELGASDEAEGAKDGMDAALLRIPVEGSSDPSNEEVEVQFAGANNPLYVVREGIGEDPPLVRTERQGEEHEDPHFLPFRDSSDGIEIKGDAQAVGYNERGEGAFTTVHLRLKKGDMCYIFSDGYADQFGGPRGKKFRYRPFKELLAEIHRSSLEEQKETLKRHFEEWKDESEQEQLDDVVVIGVRT